MPENEYGIDIVIKTDDARAGVDKTTGSITDLNAAIELAIKAAKALAEAIKFPINQFESLFSISADLVRSYDEDARAQERLASTLRLQGDATGAYARRLIDQATAIQSVTRFQDDAVVSGQALAAQVLGSSIDVERFTRVAVDLAAALDTDVGSAFQKLVQGTQSGSIRGYAQGISDATEATQRMEEVLAFLESRVGGTAERLAQIGAGPLDQFNNSIGELQDTLGKVIASTPEFQGFVKTAREFFDAVGKFAETNPEAFANLFGRVFATSFQLAAASVRVFINVLDVAGKAIASIFETLDNLSALPGFTSPFSNVEKQIEDLRVKRAQLLNIANQASVHGVSSSSPETEARLRATADQVFDLTEKINQLQGNLDRLRSGNLFAPIGEQMEGITNEIESLKKAAAEFDPLLTLDGAMQRLADNTATAREENERVAESLNDVAAAATEAAAAVEAIPPPAPASIRRRNADVQDTYSAIFGPGQEAEKRLSDINKLLADNGALLDGEPDKIEKVRAAYDEFLIASLEGQTDFGSGVERTFAQFRREAADSAAVASEALNVMADFGTDAIVDLVNTGGAGFRELAQSALVEIEKIIVRMLVLQALNALFPGLGTATGAAAGAASGVAGSAADGGDVQAGRTYIVGERGAERFTPATPGRISPLSGGERPAVNVQVVNVRHQDDIRSAISSGELDDVIMNVHARHPERARNLEQ